MADITIVQNDTAPTLKGTLKIASSGLPKDLTDATAVRFQMRKVDDRRYTVNAIATFVDRATGKVSYSWAPNDLAVPGTYIAQWEIQWGDGSQQTTDPANTIEVRRQ